ncbi:MAG: RNA polymerase sigma-70 factor [Prolixibacteraceae bacterium]|jgi:RNA polymerase sigma-70 factor (ECF subfamily)|nr:RNA polymerase sigma-70 factor [Prolixibacteraceae bacterium]
MNGFSKDIMITKLRRGDEETFIALFRQYYISLCAYSRRYVGRADIAEEIVSDTFFRMWEKHQTLEIHTSVKSYLFQAVCNNSLHFLRKLKNEEKIEDYFHDQSHENIAFEDSLSGLPEQSLLMEEISDKIEGAVNQLPPQQQKVFRLRRLENKRNREIAEIMGISVKTVEMHLAKALLSLRSSLKDYLPSFLLAMYLKDLI